MASNEFLCIGDYVCLYCDVSQGFITSWQSCEGFNQVYVYTDQMKENPLTVDNPQAVAFQVVKRNKYKLNKRSDHVAELSMEDSENQELKVLAAEAKVSANIETEDNADEQLRSHGKQVCYGDIIQLRHMLTEKFIHVNTTETSQRDKYNLSLYLDGRNGKQAQFKILPRHKVQGEREPIHYSDQLVFESIKCPGQYFHVSLPYNIDYINFGSELNLGVDFSGFTVTKHYRPKRYDKEDLFLRGGSVVRIIHNDHYGVMVADGQAGHTLIEDVHLKTKLNHSGRTNAMELTSSSLAFWQLISETNCINGENLRWNQQIRLRHMTSNFYLIVDDDHNLSLTEDCRDPNTVFRLHSVGKRNMDDIKHESYVRFEHVLTGRWLHVQTGISSAITTDIGRKVIDCTAYYLGNASLLQSQLSLIGFLYFVQICFAIGLMIQEIYTYNPYRRRQCHIKEDESLKRIDLKMIETNPEEQFSDVFVLQKVEDDFIKNLNYASGTLPFLHNLIQNIRVSVDFDSRKMRYIIKALSEMKKFLFVAGAPDKHRQKLFRNLKIVDMLVQLLQSQSDYYEENAAKISTRAFEIIHSYLCGPSHRNRLYFLKYLEFVQQQFSLQISEKKHEPLRLQVAQLLVELIKDNYTILKQIDFEQISRYAELLRRDKAVSVCYSPCLATYSIMLTCPIYLNLLCALCVCRGVAMPDNQCFIVDYLLCQKPNGLYMTEFGINLGIESNDIYISLNNGVDWVEFSIMLKEADLYFSQWNMDYFLGQLDLFIALCQDGNEYSINIITNEERYVTWKEAYFVLSNENYPCTLRAKYCEILAGLCLDTSRKLSSFEITSTCLPCISYPMRFSLQDDKSFPNRDKGNKYQHSTTTENVKGVQLLRIWIRYFLAKCKDFVASEIGQNILVEKVLYLLSCIIKYGYYEDIEDADDLSVTLLQILHGKSDRPFPTEFLSVKTSALAQGLELTNLQLINIMNTAKTRRDIVLQFHKKTRFERSIENTAIVKAKIVALEILEVILTTHFSWKLKMLLDIFKRLVYEFPQPPLTGYSETMKRPLRKLLSHNFERIDISRKDIRERRKLRSLLQSLLNKQTQIAETSFVSTLMDLTKYNYDYIVTKSLQILSRYYTLNEQVFQTALHAQILMSPKSLVVHDEVEKIVQNLKRISKGRLTETVLEHAARDVQILISPNSTFPHQVNQNILCNLDILDFLFKHIYSEVTTGAEDIAKLANNFKIKCIQLLKALALENYKVQERIYYEMDSLLGIQGLEVEIALLLKEAFRGNIRLCLEVNSVQLERLVSLIVDHKEEVPEFLQLLISILRVFDQKTPLKGKQSDIIKYFMRQFNKIADIFERTEEDRLNILLSDTNCKQREYVIQLVLLLSNFVEGENQLMESLCKSILSVDEILNILCNSNIDCSGKTAFMVYLHNVYFREDVEVGYSNVIHSRKLWKFLKHLRLEVIWLYRYLHNNAIVMETVLKNSMNNLIDSNDISRRAHATVHYLLESVMPFLRTFISRYFEPDLQSFPEETTIIDQLTVVLLHFFQAIQGYLKSRNHMEVILTTMAVLLSLSPVPQKTSQVFLMDMANSLMHLNVAELENYRNAYAEEISVTNQFHVFIRNVSIVYCGRNTNAEQIDCHGQSGSKEYTTLNSTEALPLGSDFQKHVNCFIKPNKRIVSNQYKRIAILINQLAYSAKLKTTRNSKDRFHQTALDMRCLKILRAFLHNEISKLGESWRSDKSKYTESLLKKIERIQNAMVDYDIFGNVMPLMNNKNDDIVKEMLAFIATLLFNVNVKVQDSLLRYCESTKSETIFLSIREKIHLSISSLKERRSLFNTNLDKMNEYNRIAKRKRFQSNLTVVLPALKAVQGTLESPAFDQLSPNNSATSDQRQIETEKLHIGTGTSEMKDEGYIELILTVLSRMCDGQHRQLQDYIREQPDNMKSVMIVEEVISYLKDFYPLIDLSIRHVDLVILIFRTLYKFCCGNQNTRAEIVACKTIDIINLFLNDPAYADFHSEKVIELKQTMGHLLVSLIEENGAAELDTALEVKDNLDHDAVYKVIHACYCLEKMNRARTPLTKVRSLGFTYTIIMRRFFDIDEKLQDKQFDIDAGLTQDERRGFAFYSKSISSVEIVKNDIIHKINFRVRSKNMLKEEIKEKMKWNIDRSSQADKIRDFVNWFHDIQMDIKYQKKVQSSYIRGSIAKYWSLWNNVCFVLSLAINIYMMVTWKADVSKQDIINLPMDQELPLELFDPYPTVSKEETYNRVIYVTGAVHNFFSLLVFLGYFLSNHPQLPPWMTAIKNARKSLSGSVDNEENSDKYKLTENCAVHIISFKTLYYLIFLGFSILGTCYEGYFFAFHLLNIMTTNQLLGGVIQSVTKNGKSLLWVAVLGLIIFYLYALVGFAFFRDLFDPLNARPGFCKTLFQCTVSILRYGLVGDYDEALVLDARHVNFTSFSYYVIFKLSFFIIITTIGLNIIFGVIVDTFSELRNRKWRAESDMKDRCFMCGISAFEFEIHSKGFQNHVQNEHNMWSYMLYLIHLTNLDCNYCSALDMYVRKKVLNLQFDFFPVNQALSLRNDDRDYTRGKIEELLVTVRLIAEKQNKVDLQKQRKEEQKKQQHWEEAHKHVMRRPDSSDGLYAPLYRAPEDRRRSISCPGPPAALAANLHKYN